MWKRASMLGLVLFAATVAAAEPYELQSYRDAHARFTALLAAGEGGTPKDLRTPEFAKLVDVLSDEARFLRAKPFTQADTGNVMGLCDMANRANVSLIFFGTKARLDAQLSQEDKARELPNMLNQNIVAFQAELARLQPFQFRCMGLSIPLIEEFVRALPPEQMTPSRRQGLAKMRNGYTELLKGLFDNIGDARYSTTYRGAISRATAEVAGVLASVLTLQQRARLFEVVARSDENGPKTWPKNWPQDRARIIAALQSSECPLLCSLN